VLTKVAWLLPLCLLPRAIAHNTVIAIAIVMHCYLQLTVLASGGGTALQAVLDAIAAGELNARVELIITNKVNICALYYIHCVIARLH
jgi:tartrate dehydratase alpha subunit/fumarate hydratase class I-like protein